MPHYENSRMKKKSDDEAASLIEIVERRMTAPVEAAEPEVAVVVAAEETPAEDQSDVELVADEVPPASEAESFEAALEQSMSALAEEGEAEQIEVAPESEADEAEEMAAEEAEEEMADEEAEAAEEPVFTADQALELFRVTHGGEYDPQSADHVKKMAEIEETLVEMGGLGNKSPSRFALDIYRKYKY